jgi:hypothetical protein
MFRTLAGVINIHGDPPATFAAKPFGQGETTNKGMQNAKYSMQNEKSAVAALAALNILH